MKNERVARINDEILREMSVIIRSELKDPRIGVMVSVTRVETTNDIRHCKVFVSVLGDENQKNDVLNGLKNASGFIRKLIAEKINLRITPEFSFVIDDSFEQSLKINKIINDLHISDSDAKEE